MAVIDNYQEWSWNIIDGLQDIAYEMSVSAGPPPEIRGSDNPFKVGLKLAGDLWEKAKNINIMNAGLILTLFIASLIIIIIFALITAQVILIKCEALVALLAAGVLLGLGATSFFREYAINVMKYVVAVAFKLFTMELILGLGFSFLEKLKNTSEVGFGEIAVAICVSLILLALVSYLPNMVAGLIQMSSVNSGSALMQAASTVGIVAGGAAAVAGGAAKVASGTYLAGKTLKGANDLANAEGASGFGKVASMGKSLWNASSEARSANAKITMVLDIKGENWALTAGWRKSQGQTVLSFDPSDASGSACKFNPLEEIRLDTLYAIQDVQNMAMMIVDPEGKGLADHWTKAAFSFFSGMILYSLITIKANKERSATLLDLTLIMSDRTRTTEELLEEMIGGEQEQLIHKFAPHNLPEVTKAIIDFITSSASEMKNKGMAKGTS